MELKVVVCPYCKGKGCDFCDGDGEILVDIQSPFYPKDDDEE